jgi:acetyl-CoA carboxylase biotin carboxyl carrier protein
VTDEGSNIPSPFDLRTIKHLIVLMSRHDLSEIDLQEGDLRIRLRRGPRGVAVQAVPTPPPVPVPAAASPPAAAPTSPPADKPAKPTLTIKSPTPGTFYSSPSPDAPPFVTVGSRVTPTTVVCIIEAMKIFNDIQAECSGVITEILAQNQQPVEYGQVLFKVDPAG